MKNEGLLNAPISSTGDGAGDQRRLFEHKSCNTVKLLNFRTPENFAVIYLKFKQRGQSLWVFFSQNNAIGIANSEDPDPTAPALFAQTYLSENLGSLRYILKVYHSPPHVTV